MYEKNLLTRHDCQFHWQIFTQFYQKTFDEKWGIATLNYGFNLIRRINNEFSLYLP
ncbi:hypothetical protein [Candidatus Marithrix sp. Canyon 246]|nr:hypothetical protein [Candidatus Marithrix sp. Canyon 246]